MSNQKEWYFDRYLIHLPYSQLEECQIKKNDFLTVIWYICLITEWVAVSYIKACNLTGLISK